MGVEVWFEGERRASGLRDVKDIVRKSLSVFMYAIDFETCVSGSC